MTATVPAPAISVIMPCNNAAATLSDSVLSALSQTFRGLEVVVVDDGSRDESPQVLRGLAAQDQRVRPVFQENRGAGPARNRGLREARGQFVAFLDSDDYWDGTCLQKLHAALDPSDAAIAYCGWQNIGLSGGRGEPFVPPNYEGVDRTELLLGGNRWPIHAALTRKSAIDGAGGFDESLTSCMDYDLWLRLASEHPLVLVPEVLAFYRHHEGAQITKNRARGAINHWSVQRQYLSRHPDVVARLGRDKVRDLTYGELLRRGYLCYWDRDLPAARRIFREVMRGMYGKPGDWKYMLPSLLPLPLHRAMIRMLASDRAAERIS